MVIILLIISLVCGTANSQKFKFEYDNVCLKNNASSFFTGQWACAGEMNIESISDSTDKFIIDSLFDIVDSVVLAYADSNRLKNSNRVLYVKQCEYENCIYPENDICYYSIYSKKTGVIFTFLRRNRYSNFIIKREVTDRIVELFMKYSIENDNLMLPLSINWNASVDVERSRLKSTCSAPK